MIPVYINVFNRLEMTRNLVEQVRRLDDAVPIIIDNASTWGPLLDWYETNPCELIRLRSNIGHHAPWLSGVVSHDASEWYVVTDCDLDLSGVPSDALSVLKVPFSWRSGVVKSGLGLRIDDLPEWQSEVKRWEQQYWRSPARDGYYWAAIDTTFAMYNRSTKLEIATAIQGVKCVRSDSPYIARHLPWYLDCDNLDAENAHYFQTSSPSNSWRPHGRSLTAG